MAPARSVADMPPPRASHCFPTSAMGLTHCCPIAFPAGLVGSVDDASLLTFWDGILNSPAPSEVARAFGTLIVSHLLPLMQPGEAGVGVGVLPALVRRDSRACPQSREGAKLPHSHPEMTQCCTSVKEGRHNTPLLLMHTFTGCGSEGSCEAGHPPLPLLSCAPVCIPVTHWAMMTTFRYFHTRSCGSHRPMMSQ